jgi:diamine N-acetyltransferase
MMGSPDFEDHPIPTKEEFDEDYTDSFFENNLPYSGRSFIIIYRGEDVGQINYGDVQENPRSTELDIWLSDNKHCGKGLGTDAIELLMDILRIELDCKIFYIAPSKRNPRAIRSYEKVGFKKCGEIPEWFVPDYEDAILMKQVFSG